MGVGELVMRGDVLLPNSLGILQLLVGWLNGYEVGCAPPKLAWWLSNWQLVNQEVSC